jgi:hypothetical protein
MNFTDLTTAIGKTHNLLNDKVGKTVNICTTLRNWVIGAYIQRYELQGKDRAEYGVELLENLSKVLKDNNVPGCSARNLWLFRQFYRAYPTILQTLPAESNATPSTLGLDSATLLANLSFSHFVELLKIDDLLKRSFYELECVGGKYDPDEFDSQKIKFDSPGRRWNKAFNEE